MARSALSGVDRFDQQYPAQLPARLQWLEDRLQVDRRRLLRLMGLPPEKALSEGARPWREIVREYESQADRIEHLLTHYLAYFDYDAAKAREFALDFSSKVAAGEHRLADAVPGLVTADTPSEQEEALLSAARREGSGFLPALAELLGSRSGQGSSGTTGGHSR
jgi:hypothetical protein